MNAPLRQKNPNASSHRWIKYIKRQPCAPMYGRLYHYAGNNPVRYIDPDGRETISENVFEIKMDLSFEDLENLAISWQYQYEKGTPLQQLFSAIGTTYDISTGTQIALEAIGKTLSDVGKVVFSTLDKTCFFVGLMKLFVPDNVNKPRDAINSFYFSLLAKKKDDNFQILSITNTVTFTERKSICNHHDNLIMVTNKANFVLEAMVYDNYRKEIKFINKEFCLEFSEMEF